jgi:hypothetical protein
LIASHADTLLADRPRRRADGAGEANVAEQPLSGADLVQQLFVMG